MAQTNFTFSLDEKLKMKMKSHKEINWSEIFRETARKKVVVLEYEAKEYFTMAEIEDALPKEILSLLDAESEKNFSEDTKEFQKLKNLSKKRMQELKRSEEQNKE